MLKRIMKIIITFLVLFFSSLSFAKEEVYYCSDIEAAGLYYEKNNYTHAPFRKLKFKVKLDFKKLKLDSADLYMEANSVGETICQTNVTKDFMSCSNAYGLIFTININELNFTRAATYGNINDFDNDTDSMVVYYGTCDKF